MACCWLLRIEVKLFEHIEGNSETICSADLAESVFAGIGRVEIDLLRITVVGRGRHVGGILESRLEDARINGWSFSQVELIVL